MKTLISLITFFILNASLFSQCVDSLNVYTFTYDGKTYEVVKETKNWADAASCAVERNGYLVEINDQAEQTAIYNAIISGAGVSPTYTSIATGGGIAYVWIGASDQYTEGNWLWDGNNDNTGVNFWAGEGNNGAGDGTAVGGLYYNWGGTSTGTPHEPDDYGSGQDHGAIALAGWPSGTTTLGIAGEWNDITGASLLYFVIEKDNSAGVSEYGLNLNEEISIFPNPSNGILFIDVDYQFVEIYDLNRKLIRQFPYPQIIDISDLQSNMYIVQIVGKSFVETQKMILLK